MRLDKETLSKMTISQLQGKLGEVKASYAEAATALTVARQTQVLKAKAVRGKANKKKRELISQILEIQRQTDRVKAQTAKIERGREVKFDKLKELAMSKVRQRAEELKRYGTYRTALTDSEKLLAWCHDMHVSQGELDALLEIYTEEDLIALSGDDFYDEVKKIRQEIYQQAHPYKEDDGEEELTFESVFI